MIEIKDTESGRCAWIQETEGGWEATYFGEHGELVAESNWESAPRVFERAINWLRTGWQDDAFTIAE